VGKDATDPGTARGFARAAYLTPQEPGRKVMVVLQADRLRTEAADVLLKVLEEPPADAVLMLLSARPDELPETIVSRCHVVSFRPLSESFVAQALEAEGVDANRAVLAARLAGGNLGRARRLGSGADGLSFRETAREALDRASGGPSGAIEAAELVLAAAERYRKDLGTQLEAELAPFLDERGRAEDAYRGAIRRLEERHKRQVRRAERDYVDRVLLGVSALVRDRVAIAVGGGPDVLMNPDLELGPADVASAAGAMAAVEEARAALAEDLNLNTRLVIEQAFLRLARAS
jgi:DNA polymerase-3 subunit delta'